MIREYNKVLVDTIIVIVLMSWNLKSLHAAKSQ